MAGYDESAKLFKTLMHAARLEILDILRDGEHCVCHIEAVLGYRQAHISQQLSVLREARIVQDRRDGWNIFYRVTEPCVSCVPDCHQQCRRLRGRRERDRWLDQVDQSHLGTPLGDHA